MSGRVAAWRDPLTPTLSPNGGAVGGEGVFVRGGKSRRSGSPFVPLSPACGGEGRVRGRAPQARVHASAVAASRGPLTPTFSPNGGAVGGEGVFVRGGKSRRSLGRFVQARGRSKYSLPRSVRHAG